MRLGIGKGEKGRNEFKGKDEGFQTRYRRCYFITAAVIVVPAFYIATTQILERVVVVAI